MYKEDILEGLVSGEYCEHAWIVAEANLDANTIYFDYQCQDCQIIKLWHFDRASGASRVDDWDDSKVDYTSFDFEPDYELEYEKRALENHLKELWKIY